MPSATDQSKQSWNKIEIRKKKRGVGSAFKLVNSDPCKYEITRKRTRVATTIWTTTWN